MIFKILRYLMVITVFAVSAHQAKAEASVKINFLTVGRTDAPVTITEFSSYTCPHCAVFHMDGRKWLIDTFVKTGRAKIVLHDYPLDGLAMGASMLVHSMPKDTAQAFSETLFKEQIHWATSKDPKQSLTALAGLAGLPKSKVDEVFADKALFNAIMKERKYAYDILKVDSTPTLMINGQKVMANSSREDLTQAIEAAEKAEKPAKP